MKPHLELIPHKSKGSIHTFIFEHSHFHTPWHYHEDFELTYIINSSGIRHIGNSIDNFFIGDLVLIGKNVPHCWKNENGYKKGVKSACIQWDKNTFLDFIEKKPELQQIQKLLQMSTSGIKFTDLEFNTNIGQRIFSMIEMSPTKKLIELLDILFELTSCKSKELLSVEANQYQFSEKTDTRTKAIIDYIENNYTKKIAISKMSNITYMTDGAFCKYFKKQFNRSFTNYLNEFRIRKSCILLQETNEKLLEISLKCGYENMSFFHRQFKKYLGITPFEYRKKIFSSTHPFHNSNT